MEDGVVMGNNMMKETDFSFVAPHAPLPMQKEPITPTKIQGNSSYLKKPLDDMLFTPEPRDTCSWKSYQN